MSIAEIERFAADLKSNSALRADAEKAEAGMPPATPLANVFAATKGYAFTADDMKVYVKVRVQAAGKDLTDAELGGVVGGTDQMQQMMDMMLKLHGEMRGQATASGVVSGAASVAGGAGKSKRG